MTTHRPVTTQSGLDHFLDERASSLKGRGVGVLAHQASVDANLTHIVARLEPVLGRDIKALFGPEHGVDGGAQDMIPVASLTRNDPGSDQGNDARAARPVYSLYGEDFASLSPSQDMLRGIDLLIADLQDVGARYYTFAATVALALEAMARAGGVLILLDRPNPIGGVHREGPGLEPAMRSFVGLIDVPIRHGLTIGELLLRHARATSLAGSLEVVPMRGWSRAMSFEQTGLPWIPPSPNMPTLETAWVYPGTCLLEATNVSEGRGTTRPFEWIGAPFLDGPALAARLEAERIPGVHFRPIAFVPGFQKWAGRRCGGVALHVVDRERFRPVRTGIAILEAAMKLAPAEFAWRTEPYEFVSDRAAIDLLTGGSSVRTMLEGGASWREITGGWGADEGAPADGDPGLLLYP